MNKGLHVTSLLLTAGISYAAGAYFTHEPITEVHQPAEERTIENAHSTKMIPTSKTIDENLGAATPKTTQTNQYIEKSLQEFGFSQANVTQMQWYEFLSRSATAHYIEKLGAETMLYIALTQANNELVGELLDQGVNVDKRVRVQNFKYPLYFAAREADAELFKKLVDNSSDINQKPYITLINNINASKHDVSVKREKIEYLIAMGYELTDLSQQIIPLVSYGTIDNNPFIGDLVQQLDPNQRINDQSLISHLIRKGANDELIMQMIAKMNSDISKRDADDLLMSAIRLDNIENGETITALINKGIDVREPNRFGFTWGSTAFLQSATDTYSDELFSQKISKLDAIVRAGGSITNDKITKERLLQSLESLKESHPDRYQRLESYLQ